MEKKYILAINPGSTSTKVSVFQGLEEIKSQKLEMNLEELKQFDTIIDQYHFRQDIIENWLKDEGLDKTLIKAVVGRGGLLRPMPSGTYVVTDAMIEDLKIGIQGQHASNLGGILAKGIGDELGVPSYIVDPVAVDEFIEVARISGLKEIPRKSLVHALNIKSVCHM